jgi:hypothetical protein
LDLGFDFGFLLMASTSLTVLKAYKNGISPDRFVQRRRESLIMLGLLVD